MAKPEEDLIRKQFLLTPEMETYLREESFKTKKSQSQIVREALLMYKTIKANLT